ncbi:MAG: hypothetical protein ACI9TA_002179 [Reinekea sp.]|jgi:uncharacterized protein YggE
MTRRLLLALVFCGSGIFGATQAIADGSQTQMQVQGEGRIAVAPDMARITLGVMQEAKTAAEAMDAMSVAMAAVMAQITAAGIEPKHVQTGSLRLDQRYENYDGGSRKPVGYAAFADIEVQVFDLEILGAVLDAAVRDGANQMNGLRFDVADKALHLIAARRAAVADARAKAEVYADAAGTQLGAIILISEGGSASRPSPMMAEASFDSASRSVPIAAGELSISASISMVWALVD